MALDENVKYWKDLVLFIFVAYYINIVVKLLLQKNVTFYSLIRKYHLFIMLFLLLLITDFNTWYCLWLFPTIFWLKSKDIKTVLYLSTSSQLTMYCTFLYIGETEVVGIIFFIVMIYLTVCMKFLDKMRNRKKKDIDYMMN